MLPEYSRDPCRPGGEAVPVAGGDRYQRGVDIAGAACGPLARAIIDDGCEAAVDHAPAVEGHLGAHRLHARVAHDLLVGGVACRPAGIFEPAEDDDLARLCFHGAFEIRHLAAGHELGRASLREIVGTYG